MCIKVIKKIFKKILKKVILWNISLSHEAEEL